MTTSEHSGVPADADADADADAGGRGVWVWVLLVAGSAILVGAAACVSSMPGWADRWGQIPVFLNPPGVSGDCLKRSTPRVEVS